MPLFPILLIAAGVALLFSETSEEKALTHGTEDATPEPVTANIVPEPAEIKGEGPQTEKEE